MGLKHLLKTLFFLLPLTSYAAGGEVNLTADVLFYLGPIPVSNSMLTCWVISLSLILVLRLIGGQPKLIPGKGQLVLETIIGGLRSVIEPIVGKKVFFPSFGLLSGLFFFILINNWSGLLPGVGTIGFGSQIDDHFVVSKPVIRPANADLNMTFALALIANVCWVFFIIKYAGFSAIAKDWFGNKASKGEVHYLMYTFLGIIFLAVGFIEVLSILFRPVSLTFRLFGNVFGGESLLHSMFYLSPWFTDWLIPLPFYFMEVLIGLVQALVFMLLVSVYIGLICNHEEGGNH